METTQKFVADGAKCLDSVMPDWYKKINTRKLDIDNSSLCILGQLFGSYGDGINHLCSEYELEDSYIQFYKLGFTYSYHVCDASLNKDWKKEIRRRKNRDSARSRKLAAIKNRRFNLDMVKQLKKSFPYIHAYMVEKVNEQYAN